jgi:hypothetical protein
MSITVSIYSFSIWANPFGGGQVTKIVDRVIYSIRH